MTNASQGHASLLGATLGGYEVVALIGRGAMGTVYLARDVVLKRPVALKVLLGSLAQNQLLVKSFHREAQAAAPLRHPGIVRIYSAGVEKGTPYIAMEYVHGEPLDRFLRRKNQLHWTSALYIGGQVAEALGYAHKHGVVHRDVKPANILLDQNGRVHLTDFGIARLNTTEQDLPETGGFVGTPKYMAPEQVSGGEITHAADLYALGVTLYQMIAGELPFDDDQPMVLIKKIINDEVPRLNRIIPSVPDDVARLVAHLLEKDPANRPPDAESVVQAIDRLQVEKGGRSAIPDALSAFIQENTRLPAIPTGLASTPVPSKKSTPAPGKKGKQKDKKAPLKLRAMAGLLAVCGVAVAASAWVLASVLQGPLPPPDAPAVTVMSFEDQGAGVTRARMGQGAYSLRHVVWTETGAEAMALAEGRSDSLTAGAKGVLAIDPQSKTCRSVIAPVLPAALPDAWRSRILAQPALGGDGMLTARVRYRGLTPTSVLVLYQPWNKAAPQATVLAGLDSPATLNNAIRPWDDLEGVGMAAHPKNERFCLLLHDPTNAGNYLAERDPLWKPANRVGQRLTQPGDPILPDSVRYAEGGRITYMCAGQEGQRRLYLLNPWMGQVGGTALAVGNLDTRYAVNPQATAVVYGVTSPDSPPELRLADASSGKVIARLEKGYIGAQAWHPSGSALLVIAGPPPNAASANWHLWRVQTSPPYALTPLTPLPFNTPVETAVSRDGRWAAALGVTDGRSEVIFVDLTVRTPGTPMIPGGIANG